MALYYEDDEGHSEKYTFGQIIEATNRFGNALKGIGIQRGDVVAVHLPQRPETAIAHMACYRIGAIALPISRLFGPEALSYRLRNSSAPAILIEAENVSKLDGLREELGTLKHVIVVDGRGDGMSFDDLLAKGSSDLTVEFPQTVTGKIKRRDLREMEERRGTGKPQPQARTSPRCLPGLWASDTVPERTCPSPAPAFPSVSPTSASCEKADSPTSTRPA